jgi:hypothetical protein
MALHGLGSHGFGGFGRPHWHGHDAPLSRQLVRAWAFVKLFYGVGSLGIGAVAIALVVALGLYPMGATAKTTPQEPVMVKQDAFPDYQERIVYLVGSQRAADNLLAYGAGLPTNDVTHLLPQAKVEVIVVANTGDGSTARLAGSATIIDLR